ncbi:endonuclease/exonuclease/phosphatase family protein, partial [bacterium]|nr:endonuclease/exonuclease/phosphatase family protein [bacterium]
MAMAAILMALLGCAASCGVQTGYVPETVPVHRGRGLLDAPPAALDSLRVLSWNIAYADSVDLAVRELRADPRLAAADIVLLQEMDPDGSRRVAAALGFHLAHAASMISPHDADLFGNAVLSRWPIAAAGVLVLPHGTPWTGHRRSAVWADVDLGPWGVLRAVSLHAATLVVDQEDRFAQHAAAADSLARSGDIVVFGGDFNTVSDFEVDRLRQAMRRRGLHAVRLPAGPTIRNRFKRLPGSVPVLD